MKKIFLSTLLLCVATLVPAQNRSTLIHFKDGKIAEYNCDEIDSINFSDAVTYDLDIEATEFHNTYYGSGQYQVHLSDAPISDKGLPTQVGQTLVRFYAIGEKPITGRYVASSSVEEGVLYKDDSYLCVMLCKAIGDNGAPQGYVVGFEDAVANVVYNSNGNYNIELKGTLKDMEGVDVKTIRIRYSGPMTFTNKDPESYDMLENDVTVVPTGISGRYTNVAGKYGSYTITFYNCELDSEGFIVGPGELFNIGILTEEATSMDVSKLAGSYTPTPAMQGPWNPGNYLQGELVSYYGMYLPVGTYYSVYGDGGAEINMKGFVKSGTINISVDGDAITYNCDLTTENGKKVTMNVTGNASDITDQTKGAKGTEIKSRTAEVFGFPVATRDKINDTPATLYFIKK